MKIGEIIDSLIEEREVNILNFLSSSDRYIYIFPIRFISSMTLTGEKLQLGS